MSIPDYENAMKNVGHVIMIEAMHRKSNTGNPDFVEFIPYLESYSENYDSNWKVEDIYGRIDGIANYNNTRRTIQIGLRIVSWDFGQAKENQYKISKLIQFLYPSIGKKDNINNIRNAPILRLTFGSLIFNAGAGREQSKTSGLYGFINGGLNITPVHKDGYWTPSGLTTTVDPRRQDSTNDVVIFWKYFDISFTFTVIHDHPLGEDIEDDGASRQWKEYFPYGVGSADFPDAVKELDYSPDSAADKFHSTLTAGWYDEKQSIQNGVEIENNQDHLNGPWKAPIPTNIDSIVRNEQRKKLLELTGKGRIP